MDDIEENFLQSAKFPKTWLMPIYINIRILYYLYHKYYNMDDIEEDILQSKSPKTLLISTYMNIIISYYIYHKY